MNRKHFMIVVGLVLLTGISLLLWRKSAEFAPPRNDPRTGGFTPLGTSPGSTEETKLMMEEKRRNLVSAIESMLSTPINFYGKAVDQHGEPVPFAGVDYGLLDKFNNSGSVGKSSADGDGNFTINGVRGAAISVSVHKECYYHIETLSKGSFAYGHGPDSTTRLAPTRDNPAVFVLHKMGETEPLIVVENRSIRIPKDGTPVMNGTVLSSFAVMFAVWGFDVVPAKGCEV